MLATLGSHLGNKPLMIHLATNSQPLLLVSGGGWSLRKLTGAKGASIRHTEIRRMLGTLGTITVRTLSMGAGTRWGG